MLTRADLPHLLYTDITALTDQLVREFPEVVSVETIGQTWQQRPLRALTIDARKLMAEKGVKPIEVQPLNQTALAEEDARRKEKSDDGLSEEELIEKNDDNMRAERKEEAVKNKAFDEVPDDTKADAIADQLGMEMVQMHASGIFGSSATNTDDSLYDLTAEMSEQHDAEKAEDDEQAAKSVKQKELQEQATEQIMAGEAPAQGAAALAEKEVKKTPVQEESDTAMLR